MKELLRTNDLVVISAIESLLKGVDIPVFVADQFTAAAEGSLGFLPRRVLVPDDAFEEARELLIEAGFGAELAQD